MWGLLGVCRPYAGVSVLARRDGSKIGGLRMLLCSRLRWEWTLRRAELPCAAEGPLKKTDRGKTCGRFRRARAVRRGWCARLCVA